LKKLIGIITGAGLTLTISASSLAALGVGATPASGGSIATPYNRGQRGSIATPHNGGHGVWLSYTPNKDTDAEGRSASVGSNGEKRRSPP
jgi:hypothetical protein